MTKDIVRILRNLRNPFSPFSARLSLCVRQDCRVNIAPTSDVRASTIMFLPVLEELLNPLNAKLNPICHLLAMLGAHPILHVSRIRVKAKTKFRGYRVVGSEIPGTRTVTPTNILL
jgi:hypothetical protein